MNTNTTLELLIDGRSLRISPDLLRKYNQPAPRYTSYPTAPEWDEGFRETDLRQAFQQANARRPAAPVSLYFHIPFCESLCLYCGCNVVINKNHEAAAPYLERLKQEIDSVGYEVSSERPVEQIHWGGGTPTYLSPDQIESLFSHIRSRFSISDTAEIGVEVDPRVTTDDHLRTMRRMGFNRISMGIQDFDSLVQKTIHRIQSVDATERLVEFSRGLGFESINVDLIYGLPHQTVDTFADTVDKVIGLAPDRIAVFSYAHIPWMKKQQGSFEKHLPDGVEKFRIFSRAIEKLTEAGYRYIGLDHFALPKDEISRAQDERTLHRNFQGYTTRRGCELYGMGVSAISGLDNVYAQNSRDLTGYYEAIDSGRWPTMRGFRVSDEDKLRRSVINRILCHCVVLKGEVEDEFGINFDEFFATELNRLRELEQDQLVRLERDRVEVEGLGRIFIRNVAMIFDAYLTQHHEEGARKFSTSL